MAGKDADLNLDLGGAKKKGKGKLFLIVGVAAVLVLGGGAAAFFLLKGKGDEAGEEAKDKGREEAAAHEEGGEPAGHPVYVRLKDNFVINLMGAKKDRVAQIGITFMSRNAEAEQLVEANLPLIRSTLLELFIAQNAETVVTPQGKEQLRRDAQARLAAVFKEAKIELKIDKVLFTNFVMQ